MLCSTLTAFLMHCVTDQRSEYTLDDANHSLKYWNESYSNISIMMDIALEIENICQTAMMDFVVGIAMASLKWRVIVDYIVDNDQSGSDYFHCVDFAVNIDRSCRCCSGYWGERTKVDNAWILLSYLQFPLQYPRFSVAVIFLDLLKLFKHASRGSKWYQCVLDDSGKKMKILIKLSNHLLAGQHQEMIV